MAAFESTPFVTRVQGLDAAIALVRRHRDLDVPILVAVCWVILVVAELTGASAASSPRADRGRCAPHCGRPALSHRLARDGGGDDATGQLVGNPAGRGGRPRRWFRRDEHALRSSRRSPWCGLPSGWWRSWATSACIMSSTPRRGSRSDPGSLRPRSWRSQAATSSSHSSGAASLHAAARRKLPSRPACGASADSIFATVSPVSAARGH